MRLRFAATPATGLAVFLLLSACSRAPVASPPTPTPSPTPLVAQRVDLFYPDGNSAGQVAIVDQSGLFHSATTDDNALGPGPKEIWVLPVPGQPHNLTFGWRTGGFRYCHGNPSVLTIRQPSGGSLSFTYDPGPSLDVPCLGFDAPIGVLLRFTTDVSGYTLSAVFTPEQAPPPSPSP